MKGSLYLTRPALADYIADPAEKAELAGEIFGHVGRGPHQDRDQPALRACRTRCRRTATWNRARRPARRSSSSEDEDKETSMKIEQLTCAHRRRTGRREPGRRHPRRRPVRRDPRGAAEAPRAVPARPGHHARRACGLRAPLRRAGRPSGGALASGRIRAWCRSTRPRTSPTTATKTPGTRDATWREAPPFGAVLRCVECPPVGGDTMWANMVLAYEKLPEDVKAQIADLRARHSIDSELRRGDADREAPRAEGAVSGRGASGRAHASRDRREAAVRQRLHHALHQLPHARRTCASARTTTRPAATCCTT